MNANVLKDRKAKIIALTKSPDESNYKIRHTILNCTSEDEINETLNSFLCFAEICVPISCR